jgi:hypothetical protein
MAAPEYVPRPKDEQVRVYESPPWRPEPWTATRPAELSGRQPEGPGLGSQGPDQGYALRLARHFDQRLILADGEQHHDVVTGCVAVATRRSSLFGRAPVIHDLEVAFRSWGYLSVAPEDLVAVRRPLFAEVGHPHRAMERRRIADSVPEEILRLPVAEVTRRAAADWRSVVDLPIPA